MKIIARLRNWVGLSVLFLVTLFVPKGNAQPVQAPVPPMQNVLWVWLENTSYADMIRQRTVREIWNQMGAGRFSQFKTLPSSTQTNAIQMITGETLGVTDNDLVRLFAPTLMDQLDERQIDWKVYAEDYPGNCFLRESNVGFHRYRVPFLSFSQIQSDWRLCSRITDFSAFRSDRDLDQLPQFSVVIPSRWNSGADSRAEIADQTLANLFNGLLKNTEFLKRTTIMISTISMKQPDQAAFAMIFGKNVNVNGTTTDQSIGHGGMLRTLQNGYGLGPLQAQTETTNSNSENRLITEIWSQ